MERMEHRTGWNIVTSQCSPHEGMASTMEQISKYGNASTRPEKSGYENKSTIERKVSASRVSTARPSSPPKRHSAPSKEGMTDSQYLTVMTRRRAHSTGGEAYRCEKPTVTEPGVPSMVKFSGNVSNYAVENPGVRTVTPLKSASNSAPSSPSPKGAKNARRKSSLSRLGLSLFKRKSSTGSNDGKRVAFLPPERVKQLKGPDEDQSGYTSIAKSTMSSASQLRPTTPGSTTPAVDGALHGAHIEVAKGTQIDNGNKEIYCIEKLLGGGISSQVVMVRLKKTWKAHARDQCFAMKITHDDPAFAPLIEKEIKILQRLKYQDPDQINVVYMREYFTWNNHKCIVFENLYADLNRVNKCNNCKGFAEITVRKFTRRLLVALHTLQYNELIHGDLKPENVLLKAKNRTGLKIIDFGTSTFLSEPKPPFEYVQSRWYRAPEVILGGPYTCAVDMWSLGCMVAEMMTGKALLQGDSNADQLSCIIEMFDMPPPEVLKKCARKDFFFRKTNGWPYYCSAVPITGSGGWIVLGNENKSGKFRGPPGTRPIVDAIGSKCNALCIDFIERCLAWDPELRMRPGEALLHKWIGRINWAK